MKNIRKYLLVLVVTAFSFQTSANAQEGWNFGLGGGVNMAWISAPKVTYGTPPPGTFGARVSYNVGLFAEYGFNDRLFLQIGFNFDQRGFSYKETEGNDTEDVTLRAHYFEVPFLMRYNFVAKEKINVYGLLGPSFAYLTGGRVKGESVDNGVKEVIDYKITDSYNATTFGIKVGLGFEIPFAEDHGATFFDVRYNFGLSDNLQNGGYYQDVEMDATSQVLSFVVGVRGYIE